MRSLEFPLVGEAASGVVFYIVPGGNYLVFLPAKARPHSLTERFKADGAGNSDFSTCQSFGDATLGFGRLWSLCNNSLLRSSSLLPVREGQAVRFPVKTIDSPCLA